MSGRLPEFLIKKIPKREHIRKLRMLIGDPYVHTVCEEARCPNIGECYSQGTCTFMILGDVCTRNCAFCGVNRGRPSPPDPEEPERVAEAVQKLGLDYVVITSVTRDDLPDGGAGHFKNVGTALVAVRNNSRTGTSPVPTLRIEFLIPDFQGNIESLKIILDAKPYVLNHNIETVPRLYPKIRPQANYERSLQLLNAAKQSGKCVYIKSGFMVGLGETKEEVIEVLDDLKETGCDIVTIGQYLSPSKLHLQPERYVTPEEFEEYRTSVKGLRVFAGPFVRSSYHAAQIMEQ
jgi:lipoic acid synthetase